MTVLQQIVDKASSLSPKQQIVAKHILDNWESVSFESAVTIAKRLDMSQSSIIRTIRALGFEGVPQFQAALSDYMRYRLSTIDRMGLASKYENSVQNLIGKTLKQAGDNIEATFINLTPNSINEAAGFITKAKRIYVLGMRSSASMAHFLGFNLNLLFHNITILYNDYALYEKIRGITKDDLLIVFTFARYTRLTVDATQFARNYGCKVISITDSLNAPVAGLSDLTFAMQVTSFHLTNSYVAVAAFSDILLGALLLDNPEKYKKELHDLESGFRKLRVFEAM